MDHNILIAKLFSLGVKSTVVNWIADFLRGRSQRLKLNSDSFSNSEIVPAGIPKRLYLKILKRAGVDVNSLVQFYCQTFHSNWQVYLSNKIERIQKRGRRMLCPEEHYGDALKLTGL